MRDSICLWISNDLFLVVCFSSPFLPFLLNIKLFTYSTRSEMIRSDKSSEMWTLGLGLCDCGCDCDCVHSCVSMCTNHNLLFYFVCVWYGDRERVHTYPNGKNQKETNRVTNKLKKKEKNALILKFALPYGSGKFSQSIQYLKLV